MTVTEVLLSVDYATDVEGLNFVAVEYKYMYILFTICQYIYKEDKETGLRLNPIYILY